MNFALEVPINPVSFGQVSVCILKELYKRGLEPVIFPIGNVDLSPYKQDKGFMGWLAERINSAQSIHQRTNPVFKLWHFNGALSSVSNKQVLFTFHETNEITSTESNVIDNQSKVLVSSQYTKQILNKDNVEYCPLGFDSESFYPTNKEYMKDIIVFGLYGKLEPSRKRHLKILRAWIKRFGNNQRYMLHASLFNPHMNVVDQQRLIASAMDNKKVVNINFIPYVQTNELYNQVLNSANIVIGMSGGEGFDLPVFQSLCIGKHAVVLKAHVYTDYTTPEMVTYVEPNGMIESEDGLFFKKGQAFNQGAFFDWNEDEFIAGCEKAINNFTLNPTNKSGLELGKSFTYSKTVDKILQTIETIK